MGHKGDKRYELMFLEGEFGFDILGTPVFPEFDRDIHVAEITPDYSLPILRGIDFGYRHPAVIWAQYTRDGRFVVLHELTPNKCPRHELVERVKAEQAYKFADWQGGMFRDFGDIAGEQENSSGVDDVEFWENAFGSGVESRKARIREGLDIMRRLMDSHPFRNGKRAPRFLVDASCDRLISALSGGYCYDSNKNVEEPIKDNGYDDVVDAVRYTVQLTCDDVPSGSSSRPVYEQAGSTSFANY